jgi:RsiW-degrading membrane proteinase PrsW (M82 family)
MHGIGMFIGYVIEIIPHPGMEGYDENSKLVVTFSHLRQVAYALSTASILAPWLVIFCYFFTAATGKDADIPDFVYAAFLGTFVLFSTFATNSFLCHILNKYDFATAEMIYIVLSFTAKTFLAADVFGGLNASTDDDGS